MKIQVLGCSAAELPESNLTGFLVDGKLLLDAGTIGRALDEKKQWKIKHILITHAHLDHIKDIPFFAENISIHNKNHQVTLLSIQEVLRAVQNNLLNNIVWPDFTKLPTTDNPIIKVKQVTAGKTYKIDGYTVNVLEVKHTVPSVGYLLKDGKGKTLLYIGDTGPSDTIWSSLNSTEINGLIIEVSLPDRNREQAINTGHLTPALLEKELLKLERFPDNIFITHCKPRYKDKISEQLKKLRIPNIRILKDGDILEL